MVLTHFGPSAAFDFNHQGLKQGMVFSLLGGSGWACFVVFVCFLIIISILRKPVKTLVKV